MAKTIDEGFKAFLEKLQPLKSEHDKVKTHKISVHKNLIKNFECSTFFETGSFGAKTGVRHYADTDYFAVLPVSKLNCKSDYALRKVKEAIQLTFTKTAGIKVRVPAVMIPFGQFTSERMEITPCYFAGFVEPKNKKYPKYMIPNSDGEWMVSCPTAHNDYVNKHNKRLKKGKLKNLIQLVKAWKYYNNVPISSFYLELRITKFAESKEFIEFDKDLYRVLKYLLDIALASIRDPMEVSGLIPSSSTNIERVKAISKLKKAISRASQALEAQRLGNIDNAFWEWKMLFNGKFPSR
jgi:Second Messenger Oligonucleotide or Dinucleotide Synthetase domain